MTKINLIQGWVTFEEMQRVSVGGEGAVDSYFMKGAQRDLFV